MNVDSISYSPFRFCVAPMLEWTDRHCRFFHRLLSKRARLYTEMVTSPALFYGDVPRLLDYDASEHPVALQVGGSDVPQLAHAARLAQQWGYDEINLNCGCPSERVQSGSFGACLMKEPKLVATCVQAMRNACTLPVTVKHRIGVDNETDYDFLCEFIRTVADAGCDTFIVHARHAILAGLSPKENRTVPPLCYETVRQLQRDFPDYLFILNGGVGEWATVDEIFNHEKQPLCGIMVGRWAYHDPYVLAQVDHRLFGDPAPPPTRREALEAYIDYACVMLKRGVTLRTLARPVLGLYHGQPRGRLFRQHLSTPEILKNNSAEVFRDAMKIVEPI
jgi:tRNA-dihydrouridine synthase